MRDLIVDCFAGGGGASTGIAAAVGRDPDIAINHWPVAIAMHRANHPGSRHYCESVFDVDPARVCEGRPVAMAWFSPDCTHFSKAKNGKPRSQTIRGLAWVVVEWARTVRPRVLFLENVEEFQTWGPLDEHGHPDRARAGETFREWRDALEALGYSIEFRSLVAADYGTPTTRRRLFMVARCDGADIAWPVATHGRGRARPWRAAHEIIDWSIECPSIFGRRKPLAEATLRRIAEGVRRYVLNAASPFIVPVKSWGGGGNGPGSIDAPVRTITASKRGEFALVSPTIIQTGYGERPGQAPRVPGIDKPLGTIVAGGAKHAVVAAFLTKHYGGVVGHELERPLGTITAQDHHSLTSATLAPMDVDRSDEVSAFLTKFYGTSTGADLQMPLPVVTATGQHLGLVTVRGERYQIADIGMRMLQPHELFAAQGFPRDYIIAPEYEGKPLDKTRQIKLCGNSVCPQVAEALVAANLRGESAVAA